MKCPRCQAENREGRRFCAECGAAFPVPCGSCGFANEAGAKFCGGCGRPLTGAQPTPAAAPAPTLPSLPSPQTYTPKHLAEKILSSKSALEGERKQVTVLFADIKGSMELLADRDPEEARTLLDPVLERMMEAVHRYEGTVNQVLGDGIMALFGAPLALEEHAARACYAALAMQEAINRYGQETRVKVGIRIGLNSGEVVVRAIGNDLHMDYTAIGQTTHLAARMEQTATPGSTLLTAQTLRLVEGYVEVRPLGPVPVKGLATPVEVFELVGSGVTRTRLQVSSSRGLTPFVGRQEQLTILPRALEQSGAGQGQVVALIGEAGVGKSRLIWEFIRSERTQGWLVLESRSVSYGKATTYLPVIDLLKAYFQIEDREDPRKVRDKVSTRLLALDPALESALAPLLALLDVPVEDPHWLALDPPQRRRRTLNGVKQLLLRESEIQPVVLVFEDLHWIDSETQALLDGLVESLVTARILLLVNYRPDYQHAWGGRSYYTEVRMDPLASANAEELLQALVGSAAELMPLRQRLIELTQGNPFFLEESVRTLVETRVLVGERGGYQLAKSLTSIHIPGTVQAIIAARIDRLPAELKRLLQSASVVGRDVPFVMLQAIAEHSEAELREGLSRLQAAEFLYETSLFPEIEYTFKHALTYDVAYSSLLHERRRALHGRMVESIEQRYQDRLIEHVELLAHHAFRGEVWPKAVDYYRQAGAKALARSAHPEAVTCFEQALAALAHLPESRNRQEQAVDLRFSLRNSLWPLGEIERLFDHLNEARNLAEAIGDQRRLGQISTYLSQSFVWVGDHDRGVEAGLRALSVATTLQDFTLEIISKYRLGQAYYSLGDFRQGVIVLREAVASITGDQLLRRFGLTTLPAVLFRDCLLRCLAELGEFAEGIVRGNEAVRIAESSEHSIDLVSASFGTGLLHLRQGRVRTVIALAERGLRLCESHVPAWIPLTAGLLGSAYALSGRAKEALPLLERSVKGHADMRLMGSHSLLVGWHGEAALLAGRVEEATQLADEALDLACTYKERGNEAWAHWLLGAIAAHRSPPKVETAENSYHRTTMLAEELGMRPLLARSDLGLGRLYARIGDRRRSQEALTNAATLFKEMDMGFWLEQAQAELASRGA